MTTSASNVSAAGTRARGGGRVRRPRAAPPATPPPSAPAETPRTVASRFVVLALCLAVVLSALAFGTVHSWSLALFAAGAGFVALAWAADAWRTRRLRVSRNLLQLPLVGLVAFGVVQTLPLFGGGATPPGLLSVEPARSISLDPYTTRLVVVQLASLLVYFAAALAFIDSPRRLRLLTRVVMIFGFLLAIFAMAQLFVSPDKIFGVRETEQAQGFGPFINRHHFAGYMELALALPLGLLFAGAVDADKRVVYGFLAAVMAVALVLTNSRGGMLALAAEVMFVVVVSAGLRRDDARGAARDGERRQSPLRRVARRAALGAALLAALFFGALFLGGEDALTRLVGTVNAEDPSTGRLQFWRGAASMIREHPLAGVGLGAFGVAYTRFDATNGRLYRLEQAHNDYLQLLADAGAVGALLGLLFAFFLFRDAFRRMASADRTRRGVALGALTGCFAVLVHSLFDFTLHTTANALLFLMLCALATINGRVERPVRRRRRHTPDALDAPGPREGFTHDESVAPDVPAAVPPEPPATTTTGGDAEPRSDPAAAPGGAALPERELSGA